MNLLLPFAKRFVAGKELGTAVEAVRKLNQEKVIATLDILGESVHEPEAAKRAAQDYVEAIHRIQNEGLKCNVSLKLSQMGLNIDETMTLDHMNMILDTAKACNNFVRIDMEGSDLTQATLDVFWRLRERHDNVGIVLQAYLKRTRQDILDLIDRGGSVRLCKGAYKESADIAYQNMADIRRHFKELLTLLFEAVAQGKLVHPAVATHDDELINFTKNLATEMGLQKSQFELQMLYGLRRRFAEQLAADGYTMRAYVPYGTDWLPYFYRRLRERKENVFFLVTNLFRA